jgi:hypothetical protein
MRVRHSVLATTAAVVGAMWFAVPASADPAPACSAGICTVSFALTGSPQPWTVPANITSVTITLAGGSGGDSAPGVSLTGAGGDGGKITATVPVTAGHELSVVVGGQGATGVADSTTPAAGGYGGGAPAGTMSLSSATAPGGGGGGGSFVFDTTATTLLVAVGGGGGGASAGNSVTPTNASANGGSGGSDGDGTAGGDATYTTFILGGGGQGASTTAGGAGGATGEGGAAGSAGSGPATDPTALGLGGAGALNPEGETGFGTAGGGGGGYYGGGGGGTDGPGGYSAAGGGGSAYVPDALTVTSNGANTGDGSVVISYAESLATSTTLTASPHPGVAGSPTTLTATVAPASGTTKPTGTVVFTEGSTTLGSAPVNATTGEATLNLTLPVGTHSIVASYGGASGFDASASDPLSYAVNRIATTTELSGSPNPGTAGTRTTLTATVTPASGSAKPTGTVTFFDGSTVLGTADVDPGTATLSVSLPAGRHDITASYSGTTDFAPSTAAALRYTVAPAVTTSSTPTASTTPTSTARTTATPTTTTATPTPTSTSSGPTLADTGAPVGAQLGLGLLALLLGGAMLFVGRRKYRTAHPQN